jgi:hypothetical protein
MKKLKERIKLKKEKKYEYKREQDCRICGTKNMGTIEQNMSTRGNMTSAKEEIVSKCRTNCRIHERKNIGNMEQKHDYKATVKEQIPTNNIAIGLVRVRKIRFQPTQNTLSCPTARNVFCFLHSPTERANGHAHADIRAAADEKSLKHTEQSKLRQSLTS